MKQYAVLLCLLFLFSSVQAQISVKVKKNPSGSEIDVKTSGKSGGAKESKETQTKPATSETKSTPAARNDKPDADTTPRPSSSGSMDESYNGPAKSQVKSFWGKIEMMRQGKSVNSYLIGATNLLDAVKKKDPSYNTSAMEAELKIWEDLVAKQDAEAKNKEDQKKAANAKVEEERNYYAGFWQKLIGVYSSGYDIEPGITGKAYYDRVKNLNIAEYNEKKAMVTAEESKRFFIKIDEAFADYDNYLTRSDRLRWNVTEVMVKSRGAANPQEKMKYLEAARYECEAVLLMSPNNTAFKQKLAEVNKLLGSADSEASKIYTSDFHKQNLGKIVWSTKPLVIGKEKEMGSVIKNEFKTGEAIFGTVYLANPFKQIMNGNTRLRVIIQVDKGTAIWGGDLSYFIVPLSEQNNPYYQFALLPDEQWFKENYAPYVERENWTYSYLMDELVRSGDISHDITVAFDFPTNVQGNIKSSLLLDLNSGITQIKTLSAKLHDQLMSSRTLPKTGMKNAAMEQQMVAALNKLGWKENFTKVVINSTDWAVKKNELGVILYRIVSAVGIFKDFDGKCMYQEFTFRQDYTGGGKFDSAIKYNSYGGKYEIGCDKVK